MTGITGRLRTTDPSKVSKTGAFCDPHRGHVVEFWHSLGGSPLDGVGRDLARPQGKAFP